MISYHPAWMKHPVRNGVPVFRRKIVSNNGKIKVTHSGHDWEIDDIDVMYAEKLFNGNLLVGLTDNRQCFIPKEWEWKISCFNPYGNLVSELNCENYDDWTCCDFEI